MDDEHENNEPEKTMMLKWKHIFLALSLIELAIGLSDARQNAFFYLGLPVGAALFGLFLIAQILEKESALYDEQNRAATSASKPGGVRQQHVSLRREVANNPALTMAHPH
jgi:hypothetical protein